MNSSSFRDTNGDVWSVEREMIDVTMSLPYINPNWVGVDANGHEQRTGTYHFVVDTPGDDEWPDEGHYECDLCGAEVKPGLTTDCVRRFIPGLATYYLNGEPVHPDVIRARFPDANI